MSTDFMGTDRAPLTHQQRSVLGSIEAFLQRHGFPPTLREIGEAVGLSNLNAVRGHLAALEKKGYITRAPDKARSIQVVHSPSAFSRVKRRLHEVFHTDEGVFHRVVYGLGWSTRKRRPLFIEDRPEWVREALDREAVEHGWSIREARIEPDHLVVVVETWPNHSAHQTVHRLQAAVKAEYRRREAAFPGESLWGRGYVVTTELELLDGLVSRLLINQAPGHGEDHTIP